MVLQGQNEITVARLDRTTWAVCLGRIRLPTLPLTRSVLPSTGIWFGERTVPGVQLLYGLTKTNRLATVDRARVALKVTKVSAMFEEGEHRLYGMVESCGIQPNLRSIINEVRMSHLCFLPRVVTVPSDDIRDAQTVTKVVAFDLVPYEA
jgi:hypothetical protein